MAVVFLADVAFDVDFFAPDFFADAFDELSFFAAAFLIVDFFADDAFADLVETLLARAVEETRSVCPAIKRVLRIPLSDCSRAWVSR